MKRGKLKGRRRPPPVGLGRGDRAPEVRIPGQEWDRRPGETLESFEKFRVYRDTSPSKRSQRAVAEQFRVTETRVKQLAQKHRWTPRVAAWDAHCDALAQAAHENAIVEMNRRQATLGMSMQGKAARGLINLEDKGLSASDVSSLATAGAKIERLARGQASERVEGDVRFAGLGDALKALRREDEAGEAGEE